MKITIQRPVEVEAHAIRITIPVSDDGDPTDMPQDFPLKQTTLWKATIEVDTGRILNWPEGVEAKYSMHEKVRDAGIYELLDAHGAGLAIIGDYVPNRCIPGEFGDYIEMEIENGAIKNWRKPTEEDLVDSFFPPKED